VLTAGAVAAAAAAAAAGPAVTRAAAARAAQRPAAGAGLPARLSFPDVPPASRPRFRYWWPGADVTPAQIAAEVNAIADAGFAGFEIGDVRNSEHEAMPAARYGWGSPAWKDGLAAALRTAQARGLEADIYIGPYWPAVAAGIQPDDDSAMKELTYGQAVIAGGATFSAAVPAPHSKPSGIAAGLPAVTVTPVLEAVHAARIVGAATASPLVIEQATLVDITGKAAGGSLTWTAPAGGSWVIIASYSRGTAMIERQAYYEGYYYDFTVPPAYVVDHFGAAGGNAIVYWWEKDLLTAESRALFGAAGGTFFEDSLEFLTELHWTPGMLAEFSRRRGYPLTPYLPLVQGQSAAVYAFENAATSNRIRWDYFQTLSDLFIDNHVTLLDDWARTLGMKFRNQAYGAPLDCGLAAASTGVPEGETLGFAGNPDSFRVLAAGRDLGRRGDVLSCEMGAVLNGAYRQTIASEVVIANTAYAVGVNQVRVHGFPYASSPSGQWPGFYPWAPLGAPINFAEAWGPRQPQWQFIGDWSGYQARVHQVLRSGTNKVDVAIYREGFDQTQASSQFDGAALTNAGYSYQLLDWGLLGLPAARVRDGLLDRDGPAYKALVIANQATMLLDSAEKILGYARAGLPVVVIGDLPSAATGFANAAASDKALAMVLRELLQTPGVTRVATAAALPAALGGQRVSGSAVPDGITGLLHVRRVSDGGDTYYFLLNTTASAASGTVTLEGSGRPYAIDAWTGGITPLGRYDGRAAGLVSVPVAAGAGEAVIIALAAGQRSGSRAAARYAVSAETEIIKTQDGLRARVTAPGTYRAVLDNGRAASARVSTVPAPPAIGAWAVTIEDWRPADPGGVEGDAIGTTKVIHSLSLTELASWQHIPGLEDVSGVGTYTTTISVPDSWPDADGAYLGLGSIGAGSAHVRVNGADLGPVNQISPVIDLGKALKPGANVLTVTVATTLMNRLRITRPTVYTQPRQDYGLIGPVTITPYADAALG
jgi:hypothetical protein